MKEVELSREALYEMVWTAPLSTIATKYQISDVGLRKICKRLNIPTPDFGHWQKIKAGHAVTRKPLTADFKGEEIVYLLLKDEQEDRPASYKSQLEDFRNSVAEDKNLRLGKLRKLSELHPLVAAAKSALESRTFYHYQSGFLKMFTAGANNLDIKVISSSAMKKAYRFLNVFIRALELRGHRIRIDSKGTYVLIGDQRLKIIFREKAKRVATGETYTPYKYDASGVVALQLDGYPAAEWKDDKEELEAQLVKILAKLEWQAHHNQQEQLRREVSRQRQQAEEDARLQALKQKEKELSDFKLLLARANRWKQSQILRDFLAAGNEQALAFLNDRPNPMTWARQKADWYDPTVEKEDSAFSGVDRDQLT